MVNTDIDTDDNDDDDDDDDNNDNDDDTLIFDTIWCTGFSQNNLTT